MRLILRLAWRDILRDRLALVCNVAVIVGVLVPLLVLLGAKNGVYETLIGRLLANPATLQIDTAGNSAFTEADVAEVRGWPEVQFATLKTRSLFDYVNVRPEAGRGLRDAVLAPSGPGDPTLPEGLAFGPGDVAVSAALAEALGLAPGAAVELLTQAPERPRQLVLVRRVAAVIPADRMAGRTVLADIATLDLVEAFYDAFALPEHGILAGRPLSERVAAFEGMRVYARDLETLGPLQRRLEARFGIAMQADTRAVEAVLGLGRSLDLALALVAAVAAAGLAATLVFGFWGEVARKRRVLAGLALRGVPPRQIAAFPVIQAAMAAMLALIVSFLLFAGASRLAARIFDGGPAAGGTVVLPLDQALWIAVGVFGFVLATALAAARQAARIDPALVLRDVA